MRGSTLARGTAVATVAATAVFGFSILAGISTSSSAREQDEVKTFKLTRGKLQITNFADFEKPAVVRIRDQEFTAGREYTSLYRQFRLPDRDVLIISNDPMGSGVWPSYRIIVVPFKGAAREVDHPDFDNPDTTFEVTQTGNVIKFDLGYDNGFKKDAVLTSKGLMVLNKRVARPMYSRNECKWIYGQALGECLANVSGDGSCVNMHRSMSTVRGLYHLEENPRWAVAKNRFDLACKKAVKRRNGLTR